MIRSNNLGEYDRRVCYTFTFLSSSVVILRLRESEIFANAVDQFEHAFRSRCLEVASQAKNVVQNVMLFSSLMEIRLSIGQSKVFWRFVFNITTVTAPVNDPF